MDLYELAKLFFWSLWMAMFVAAAGVGIDLYLIIYGKKAWLKPKWLWNLAEFAAIFGLITWKYSFPLPWWHMGTVYLVAAFFWWILHDCWIGFGLKGDPFYLGQGKFDRQMFTMFNQFGLPAGLNFLAAKLFWAVMAGTAFFNL